MTADARAASACASTAYLQARCRPSQPVQDPPSPYKTLIATPPDDPTPSIQVRQGDSPLAANRRDRGRGPSLCTATGWRFAPVARGSVVLVDEPPRLDVLGELVRRGPVTSLRRAGKGETANGA